MEKKEAEKLDRKPFTTAIHEAGHAIVHLALGHQVAFVTIVPAEKYRGLTLAEPCSPADEILLSFAGGWAQRLFSDEPPKLGELRSDLEAVNRILNIPPVFPTPALILQREELCVRALKIVIANEQAIKVVADYLVQHKEIGREDGAGLFAGDIIKNILDPSRVPGYSLPGDIVIPLVMEPNPEK